MKVYVIVLAVLSDLSIFNIHWYEYIVLVYIKNNVWNFAVCNVINVKNAIKKYCMLMQLLTFKGKHDVPSLT